MFANSGCTDANRYRPLQLKFSTYLKVVGLLLGHFLHQKHRADIHTNKVFFIRSPLKLVVDLSRNITYTEKDHETASTCSTFKHKLAFHWIWLELDPLVDVVCADDAEVWLVGSKVR